MAQSSIANAEANGFSGFHCFEDELRRLIVKVYHQQLESLRNDVRSRNWTWSNALANLNRRGFVAGGNFNSGPRRKNSNFERFIKDELDSSLLGSTELGIFHHHRENSVIESILQLNYNYTRFNVLKIICVTPNGLVFISLEEIGKKNVTKTDDVIS